MRLASLKAVCARQLPTPPAIPPPQTTPRRVQGRDRRWEAGAVAGLARLRELQLELQASSRRCACFVGLDWGLTGACCVAAWLAHAASAATHSTRRFTPPLPACSPRRREGLLGLSVAGTLRQCLRLGLKDQAAKLAREFKVGAGTAGAGGLLAARAPVFFSGPFACKEQAALLLSAVCSH